MSLWRHATMLWFWIETPSSLSIYPYIAKDPEGRIQVGENPPGLGNQILEF